MKYRCYWTGNRKADAIMSSRQSAEYVLPTDCASIVKLYRGRELVNKWIVSWMGDHWKWAPCCCESDR